MLANRFGDISFTFRVMVHEICWCKFILLSRESINVGNFSQIFIKIIVPPQFEKGLESVGEL